MQTATPVYGKSLIVNVIDERAKATPQKLFACIPKGSDPSAGFHDVTYGILRRAVDSTARFLEQNIGQSQNWETFAWIGPPADFRYILLALAAMKTGHKAYFPSPRNSLEAHVSLLKQCQCQFFLQAEELPLLFLDSALQQHPMKHIKVPGIDQMLFAPGADEAVPFYPYDKQFDEARYDPCMVLHTSGSTGIPKAIVLKQGWFSHLEAYRNLAKLGGSDYALARLEGHKTFIAFPNFHSAAIAIKISFSIFFDCPMVSPPNGPLTADVATAFHEHVDIDASFLPPSIIRDIMKSPRATEMLTKVKYVCYGGSPLADDVARALQDKTYIINAIGVTETGLLPMEVAAPEDLQYLHFGPYTGIRFDHVAKGQYESVITRDPSLDLFQGIFVTYPDIDEWPTKDLWSKHPTKAHHWLYQGRTDDVIVFHNGEKLNPLTFQQMVESHPDVMGALVAGTGRFQACLLVEPHESITDEGKKAEFLDKIWPTVDQANSVAVAHGRIDRTFMLVADKPFLRAGKGSIQRKLTLDQNSDQINALYDALGDPDRKKAAVPSVLDLTSFEAAKESLRQALGQLGFHVDYSDDADLFAHGLDSLHVANLGRRIAAARHEIDAPTKIVYEHPTIESLARCLTDGKPNLADGITSRSEQMSRWLEDLSKDLPINARSPVKTPDSMTVLLTGSSGSLGCYLLDALLRSPKVGQIICLNRSASAATRQEDTHRIRALSTNFDSVEFLQYDIATGGHLGLDIPTYRKLLASVTHVLHNAWPVDFNLALPSFVAPMAFVRQIINFASQSAHAAHLCFISTIGVTQNFAEGTSVPERVLTDWSVSPPMGYAESKHISEVLLARAVELGISASIRRVGQIAGPVLHGEHGEWPRQEWLPSLIESSVMMNKIPETLGAIEQVDWMPVDVLSEVIVELLDTSFATEQDPQAGGEEVRDVQVHHLVNPQQTSWSELLPAVLAALPEPKKPSAVPLHDWIAELHAHAQSEQGADATANFASIPALKLLGFFDSLNASSGSGERDAFPVLETKETVRRSSTLDKCEPVSQEWMTLWMRQWGF